MVTALERLGNAARAHTHGSTLVGDNSVDAYIEDGEASSIHISTTAKYHDKLLVVMMLT